MEEDKIVPSFGFKVPSFGFLVKSEIANHCDSEFKVSSLKFRASK